MTVRGSEFLHWLQLRLERRFEHQCHGDGDSQFPVRSLGTFRGLGLGVQSQGRKCTELRQHCARKACVAGVKRPCETSRQKLHQKPSLVAGLVPGAAEAAVSEDSKALSKKHFTLPLCKASALSLSTLCHQGAPGPHGGCGEVARPEGQHDAKGEIDREKSA